VFTVSMTVSEVTSLLYSFRFFLQQLQRSSLLDNFPYTLSCIKFRYMQCCLILRPARFCDELSCMDGKQIMLAGMRSSASHSISGVTRHKSSFIADFSGLSRIELELVHR
jgi:hypothetical protein